MKKIKLIGSIIIVCLLVTTILLSQQSQSKDTTKIIFQDDFKQITSWELYKDDVAQIKTSSSKNNNLSALKVSYDLKSKTWVAFEKPVNLMLNENCVLKFKMSATGNNNYLEIKFVDKDGSVFGTKLSIPTNGWQDVVINVDDMEYWWGGDEKLDAVVRLGFAVSKKDGGSGVVEVSDLKIVEEPKKVKKTLPPDFLDDFETKKRWAVYTSDKAQLVLKNLPGKDGNSLVAEYDLGDAEGQWVAFEKQFKLDFSKNKTIKFWVKAEGEVNRLEFKVIDQDGSIFGVRYEDLTSNWEEITINVDDLEYWWGGDNKLTKPIKIGFAISTIDGGKGKIWLDNLRLTK
jgi:hypothetical protein